MKMFRKHYEKFIFMTLLLLFLILFGLQATSIANPEKDSQFNVREPRADYEAFDFTNDKFHADAVFRNAVKKPFSADTKENKDNLGIDLLVPPVLAKCPKGEHLIPVTDFPSKESELKQKKCSFCASPLEYIPPEQVAVVDPEISTRDSDNDGIPDADEVKLGLDPHNAHDAAKDSDEDGFTNLEEYRSKTDINDPKSRDSYAKKLYVKSIKESPIGITLVRFLNDRNEQDTSKWMAQFASETKVKRGKTERITKKTLKLREGRDLKKAGFDGSDYVLEKIVPKFGDNQGERENISTVILKRKSDGLLFEARNGGSAEDPRRQFIDPRKEVVYELDLSIDTRKEIVITVGQEFKIGNEKTGVDKFITISAVMNPGEQEIENRMTAKIKNVERGNVEDIKTRQNNLMEDMIRPEEPPKTIKKF